MSRLNPFGAGGGSGPGAWQWERGEQVRHYRNWVYTCIDFISAKITEVPPSVAYTVDAGDQAKHAVAAKVYRAGRGPDPGRRDWVPKHVAKSAAGSIRPNDELEYADASDPLLQLILNPNEPDTWVTFWRQQSIYYHLTGVAYTWCVPSESGSDVAELWTIPSHWVKPVCLGRERLVDYYEVTPYGASGGSLVRFDPSEMIEVKSPNPLNILGAQSPLQANSEIIDQYESVQQSRYWSNKNGAAIGAVLQINDERNYPTDEELRRLESSFYARFQGEAKFNRPMVLPPGTTIDRGQAERELAFVQSSDQLRDYVVSQTFRLSRTALGITDGVPWATFVGEMRRVIQDVINPVLAHFGGVFTEKLASRYGDNARIFWVPKVPHDDTQRLAEWQGTPGPAVSVNEYRSHILNLEPLDDPQYDTPMQPVSMVPGGGDPFGTFDGFGEPPEQESAAGEQDIEEPDVAD